jgi:two-component system copper resistance phosphate regulon response regulator CusR
MKLLLVDDEENILKTLKSVLETEGWVVDIATDGEKALSLGLIEKYDLLILDYNLPKKSGLEVCKELRASGKTVPILMISVRTEVDDKVDLLNAGADDYLSKPLSSKELIARAKALFRRPPEIKESVLKVDDLVLNKTNKTVFRNDKEIYLTRKEFSLLEFLMENTNRILSRTEIMERVWGSEIDSFSNTVETHILRLRKKIDGDYEKKLIKTFPGRGYKMGER